MFKNIAFTAIKAFIFGLAIYIPITYWIIDYALTQRGIENNWLYLITKNEALWPESTFKLIGEFGPIGDFIGGILNPLFALCAFIALFISLNVQRKSFAQQLDQENFFTLLANRETANASLELRSKSSILFKGKVFSGKSAIREIIEYIDKEAVFYNPVKNSEKMPSSSELSIHDLALYDKLQKRVEFYSLLYNGRASDPNDLNQEIALKKFHACFEIRSLEELFGHIFRSTYQVMKFVHSCESFSESKKTDLINYLRAQMGESEFVVFGLSALTKIGAKSRAESIFFDLFENRLEGSYGWAGVMRNFLRCSKDNRILIF